MKPVHTFQFLYNHNHDWLRGASTVKPYWKGVLNAFYRAKLHHNGLRNGDQPEFIHQMEILYDMITAFQHIRRPEIAMVLGLMHDAIEDPNQHTKEYLKPSEITDGWGLDIANQILMLSKEIEGVKNPDYSLNTIFGDVDMSIAKSLDRKSNVKGMWGVFKVPRLERYMTETEQEFLPRMEDAAQRFPDQAFVYLSAAQEIKLTLAFINKELDNGKTGFEAEEIL